MKEIDKINIRADKVTIVVVERDMWGGVRKRQQMTFRRRQFESALRTAEITVPWQEVKP